MEHMGRPAKNIVDGYIRMVDKRAWIQMSESALRGMCIDLVAEVRALREEVALPDLHRSDVLRLERENETLRATIARVEALLTSWRTETANIPHTDSDVHFCISDLEDALRGES